MNSEDFRPDPDIDQVPSLGAGSDSPADGQHAPPRDGDGDESGFNPTLTAPIFVEAARLPPPLELSQELKFSFEPGVDQAPAWSYDDGVDDAELARLDQVPVHQSWEIAEEPRVPQHSRFTGNHGTHSAFVDSLRDLADRRWFLAGMAAAAVVVIGGGLVAAGVMPVSRPSGDRPDVVADGSVIQPSADASEGPSSGLTGAAGSPRLGEDGLEPAAGTVVDDGVDSTTTTSTSRRAGSRSPNTTIATTGSTAEPDATTSSQTTSSTTSSSTSTSTSQATTSTTAATTSSSTTAPSTTRPSTTGPSTTRLTTTTTTASTTHPPTTWPTTSSTTDPSTTTTTDSTTTTEVETTSATEPIDTSTTTAPADTTTTTDPGVE